MGTKKRATALLFSLLWIWPFIKVRANEWPGCSVAEKVELLDAVFPKSGERVAQLEEAKRNAMPPLPSRVFHSAELELKVKAKAAEHFYTHMREQYTAVG
uniref:Secreted protein n=1 Tax=Globodera pallida TaxID=36090 RepID=A0A183CJ70_GLOPA